MKPNSLKQQLAQGATVFGTMIGSAQPQETIWILGQAGFDFVMLDTEHAPLDLGHVETLCRAGTLFDVPVLVRVPDCEYHLIAETLDAGAQGIMVPRVETKAQAELAVASVKYPPLGRRGLSIRPLLTAYKALSLPERIQWSNDNTILITQIESAQALEDLDEILSVPHIDVALIGPADLSVSLGIPGELDHPRLWAAVDHVAAVAKKHGLAAGSHMGTLPQVIECGERGMRCLMYSSDTRLLAEGARASAQALRQWANDS